MPIMLDGRGSFALVCLNQHRTEDGGSTMRAVADWLSIPTAEAPTGPVRVRDLPLRCYYCDVCGYVEMYMPKGAIRKEPDGG